MSVVFWNSRQPTSTKMSKRTGGKRLQARNMVWTLNAPKNLSEEAQLSWLTACATQIDKAFKENEMATFLAYQMERVENSHIQGMIQWSKRTGMRAAKQILGKTAHIEKMRGTPTQALRYVQKAESRIPGTAQIETGEFKDHIAISRKAGAAGGKHGGDHWTAIREAIEAGATK